MCLTDKRFWLLLLTHFFFGVVVGVSKYFDFVDVYMDYMGYELLFWFFDRSTCIASSTMQIVFPKLSVKESRDDPSLFSLWQIRVFSVI